MILMILVVGPHAWPGLKSPADHLPGRNNSSDKFQVSKPLSADSRRQGGVHQRRDYTQQVSKNPWREGARGKERKKGSRWGNRKQEKEAASLRGTRSNFSEGSNSNVWHWHPGARSPLKVSAPCFAVTGDGRSSVYDIYIYTIMNKWFILIHYTTQLQAISNCISGYLSANLKEETNSGWWPQVRYTGTPLKAIWAITTSNPSGISPESTNNIKSNECELSGLDIVSVPVQWFIL